MTENIVNPYADIIDTVSNDANAVDVNEVDNKGFTKRDPARAGVALFRFVSYIETGNHTVEKGQGKGKQQDWADFKFELVHPDHMIGEGDKAFPDTLEMSNVNVSRNEKAKYKKLFDQMNWSGKYTNFAQMLGQGFLGRIVHNKVEDKVYVNLETIGAPRYEPDPVGAPGVIREVAVPPAYGDLTLFLFDAPGATAEQIQRMWDGIEITGDKADGTPRKNWIQDKVRKANNWSGSFVQSVVDGDASVSADLADAVVDATAAVMDSPVDTTKAEAAGATVVDAPAQTAAVVDPLADIPGL